MKPIDVRNAVWADIQGRLAGDRRSVYAMLLGWQGEPVTARGLAERMGRDVLSVAPRLTELVQLGLARCVGRAGRRGLYEAVPLAQAQMFFEQAKGRAEQILLRDV